MHEYFNPGFLEKWEGGILCISICQFSCKNIFSVFGHVYKSNLENDWILCQIVDWILKMFQTSSFCELAAKRVRASLDQPGSIEGIMLRHFIPCASKDDGFSSCSNQQAGWLKVLPSVRVKKGLRFKCISRNRCHRPNFTLDGKMICLTNVKCLLGRVGVFLIL